MFWHPNKVIIGHFGDLRGLIDISKAFELLKTGFESSIMVFINDDFRVVVGAAVLAVDGEDKDGQNENIILLKY